MIFRPNIAVALLLSALFCTASSNTAAADDEAAIYAESNGDGFDSETGAYNPDPSNSEISAQESLEAPLSESSEISGQESPKTPGLDTDSSRNDETSDRAIKLARESTDLAVRAGLAEGLRLLAFWPDDVHDMMVKNGTPIVSCNYPYTFHCAMLNLGDLATNPDSSLGAYQFTLDPSLPPTSFSALNQNAIAYTDRNLRRAEHFDPTPNKTLSTVTSFLGFLAPQMARSGLAVAGSGNPLQPAATRLLRTGEPQLAYAMASKGLPGLRRETIEAETRVAAPLLDQLQSSLTVSTSRPLTTGSVPNGEGFKGSPEARRLLDATLKNETKIRNSFENRSVDFDHERAIITELDAARKAASKSDVESVGNYLSSLNSKGESWACLGSYHLHCVDPWVEEFQKALQKHYRIDPSQLENGSITRGQMSSEIPETWDAYRRANLTHEEIFQKQLASGSNWFETVTDPGSLSSYGETLYREWKWARSGGQYFYDTYSRRADANLAELVQNPNVSQWTEADAVAYLEKTIFARSSWINDEANFVFLRAAAQDAVREGKLPPSVVDLLTNAFLKPQTSLPSGTK